MEPIVLRLPFVTVTFTDKEIRSEYQPVSWGNHHPDYRTVWSCRYAAPTFPTMTQTSGS